MYKASVNYKELKIVKKTKEISSPFSSPLLKLIHFIYKNHQDIALFILRKRITLNYSPSKFELALIKVTAKRYTSSETFAFSENIKLKYRDSKNRVSTDIDSRMEYSKERESKQGHPKHKNNSEQLKPNQQIQLTHEEAMGLAIRCSKKSILRSEKYRSDRQVGAVLLDSQNYLLSTGYNKSSAAKFQHAELDCIRSFWNKNKMFIPAGSKLFVTLKPCRMCAALLFECSQAPETLQIFYQHYDPGPLAQNTLLEPQIKPY